MNIYEKLLNIQNELKCNKGQYNSFGKYNYRSCEDILEAVKPLCKKYNVTLVLSDTLEYIGDRYYIKAVAQIIDVDEPYIDFGDDCKAVNSINNTAYAREEETKKGMDGSQITGTSSSYARKYALNGLFNIDDTKDADTDEFAKQTQEGEKTISKVQAEALVDMIKNKEIETDEIVKILANMNYKKVGEIKLKDYMTIHKIIEDYKK